jgi:hypothetical protein
MLHSPMAVRKRNFKAALALAEMSRTQFAAGIRVSDAWIGRVLNEHEPSQPVLDAIDAFIREHLPQHAAA